MKKTLIVIRHAHRDKELGREIDNGLSDKGQRQSQRILKHFQRHYPDANPVIASSPKKRCVETLLPFVNNRREQIATLSCLDEGEPLDRKVGQFLAWWDGRNSDLTIICSHGDWIPVCIERLSDAAVDLKKGAWARLHGKPGNMKLVEVIQKF